MSKLADQKNSQKDWSEFCAPGTNVRPHRAVLSNGVSLRVVSFYPPSEHHPFPVVMVPGLVSVMLTFRKILIELTRDFVVHYVETREKSSSVVPKGASYDVAAIGSDVVEIISQMGLKHRQYILFGASLGATALLDQYRFLRAEPFCLVLLEPNAVFDYPKWSLPVIRFAAPLFRVIRPVAKWYLKNIRMNTKEDYEMYRISSRALDAADPHKLRNTILAISKYQIWDRLHPIATPALVVSASKDTFHRHEDITRIVSLLGRCTHCDLEIHERTHSAEFVECVRQFVGQVGKTQPVDLQKGL